MTCGESRSLFSSSLVLQSPPGARNLRLLRRALSRELWYRAAILTSTLLTGRTNSFAVLANPSKEAASASSIPFHIQHPVEFPLEQFGPRVITFPPRNEPNVFSAICRPCTQDQLHRTQTALSYVDPEGENVWLTEYFRFSLNGCSHDQAVQRTLLEISTGGQQPTCGAETPTFPSRELPNLFQAQLEAAYRDVLRRSQLRSYVDTEGANVWLAEYLRYRVSGAGCDHATAENKVFTQIQGGGVQPVCGTPPPTPASLIVTGNTTFATVGQTSQMTATVTLSDGTRQDQTRSSQWTSSNNSVAIVNASGVVTSQGVGSADVRAAYQNVSGAQTVRVTLQSTLQRWRRPVQRGRGARRYKALSGQGCQTCHKVNGSASRYPFDGTASQAFPVAMSLLYPRMSTTAACTRQRRQRRITAPAHGRSTRAIRARGVATPFATGSAMALAPRVDLLAMTVNVRT